MYIYVYMYRPPLDSTRSNLLSIRLQQLTLPTPLSHYTYKHNKP